MPLLIHPDTSHTGHGRHTGGRGVESEGKAWKEEGWRYMKDGVEKGSAAFQREELQLIVFFQSVATEIRGCRENRKLAGAIIRQFFLR